MMAKISAVRTDGLPEDLVIPFYKLKVAARQITEHYKEYPTEHQELQKWLAEKVTADPAFSTKMMEKMSTLGAKIERANEQLKKAGAKYGIEELDPDREYSGKGKEGDAKEGDADKNGKDEKDEKEEKEK
jgi:hypothetical protein